MEKIKQSFAENTDRPEESMLETRLAGDITLDNFENIISNINSIEELEKYRNELESDTTRIIKKRKLFTEDKKDKPGKPIDPDFKGVGPEDLFYSLDDKEIETILDNREQELVSQKRQGANIEDQEVIDSIDDESDKGIEQIALERHEASKTSTGSSDPDPTLVLYADQLEEPASLEDSIAEAKSIKELSVLLAGSSGIESHSQGKFSGADLVFLIDRIKNGDAYIEELTREKGLREKVWNLLISETGHEPKSLENEENNQDQDSQDQISTPDQYVQQPEAEKLELPAHPPAPTDRLKKIIPLTPVPENKSIWGGIKKLFGFGKK